MDKITGVFDTRREAEMSVERLVQEHGVDRAAIMIAPVSAENSVGVEVAGSDAKRGEPVEPAGDEAALNGRIAVSVDPRASDAGTLRSAFKEFGAVEISGG